MGKDLTLESENQSLLLHKENSSADQLREELLTLSTMPHELFIIYFLNFISSVQYYILITLIPLYFSEMLNYSDLIAGLIFGGMGVSIGVLSIILGPYMELIGLKLGLCVTYAASLGGFCLLVFTSNFTLSTLAVFTLIPLSGATAWPVLELGSKHYTTRSVRSLNNSLILVTNYFAGAVTGVLIDSLWRLYIDSFYVLFFGIGAVLGVCGLIVVLLFIGDHKGETEVGEINNGSHSLMYSKKRFWRYVGVITLLTLLRAGCFGQLDATLAKYMLRTIGSDAHFGLIMSIHSVNMLLGVFFLTMLTYNYSSYSLIVVGGLIGSTGTIMLILDSSYFSIVAFTIILSIGESIWVPRLLDYTLKIAPTSEEGMYLALCNCPFYFGMIITGAMSGLLLETYCTEDNNSQCWMLWLIVWATSVIFPIILLFARRVLEQPETEEQPYISCSKHSSVF